MDQHCDKKETRIVLRSGCYCRFERIRLNNYGLKWDRSRAVIRVAMGWFVRKSRCWVGSVKGYCWCVSSDRSESDERRWLGFWFFFLREGGRWWIVLFLSVFFLVFSFVFLSLFTLYYVLFLCIFFLSLRFSAKIFRTTYLLIYRSFIRYISFYPSIF